MGNKLRRYVLASYLIGKLPHCTLVGLQKISGIKDNKDLGEIIEILVKGNLIDITCNSTDDSFDIFFHNKDYVTRVNTDDKNKKGKRKKINEGGNNMNGVTGDYA